MIIQRICQEEKNRGIGNCMIKDIKTIDVLGGKEKNRHEGQINKNK